MSDLKFLALDECDRFAKAEHEIVMRKHFVAQVASKTPQVTKIDVAYWVVSIPRTDWTPQDSERIRDLDFDPTLGSVIADL